MPNDQCKLEVHGVSIEFPGVKALSNVNFDIETGDIRAVVGANGAGKSTLMKVLSGANPTYTGDIFFKGQKVELSKPAKAKELGIEIVYQEVDMALFPSQTVAENIMMNNMISSMKGKSFVNWKFIRREAKKVLDRMHINVDEDQLVSKLSLAQKQMVLIARAVREQCNFLILDEPTAPLSHMETEELFRVIRDLMTTERMAVIFISHRLQEVLAVCKSITVMRNGEIVCNMPVTKELTIREIVEQMLGRSYEENFPRSEMKPGEVVFEVKRLENDQANLHDISFYIREGEIIGLAGLVGAGKTELCKTLFGEFHHTAGELFFCGKPIKIKSTQDAVRQGIGLVPEERRKEGILVNEPIYFNLSAACLPRFCGPLGFVKKTAEKENADKFIKNLNIKTPSNSQMVKYLSGGNQQKVAVGKWLAADCEVYIFDEPTKGVDVGAKRDIFLLIQNIAKQGKCVLYATCETSEILSITDRTYVIYNGTIRKELVTAETNEDEIMYYSTGGR
jgi:simple sugar transport system ATP-binding protein